MGGPRGVCSSYKIHVMEQRAAKMEEPSGACGEPSGRDGGGLHVTVRRRADGRLSLELCKQCNLYHCPFCQSSAYKPKRDYASVWTHIEIHRMRALQHGEFIIHSCHLSCRRDKHFHCPYCGKTITAKRQFEGHLDRCSGMQTSTATSSSSQSAAPGGAVQPATAIGQCAVLLLNLTPPSHQVVMMAQSPAAPTTPTQTSSTSAQRPAASPGPVTEPTATPDPVALPTAPQVQPSTLTDNTVRKPCQAFKTARRKIKCPLCNLHLHKKNLRKHNLRKHLISEKDITAKDHLRSQCVDAHSGVYAVAKSYKSTAIPVHVMKKRSGGTHTIMCQEERCDVISKFRKKSGLPESQCPHLRSVDFCFTHANSEDLKPAVLEELVTNKWIGDDMAAKCLSYHDQAIQDTAPLVALVDIGGSHYLYMSVFEPEALRHSKVGRLFVTYNVKGRLWHCDCFPGRISCLHKCLAKWFLFQTNKDLFSSVAKQEALLNIATLMEEPPAESSAAGALLPLGEQGLKPRANYIYQKKRLPSSLPENITKFDLEMYFSKPLVPTESVCQVCPGQVSLTEPVLITNKAKVITVAGVMEDNSTFFKKCPDCEMVYHYQEWTEGLHNYNNHIILSLQLCVLLQNTIKNHSSDAGVVEVLEQTIGDMAPCGMTVLQAYLHFEALTSHECLSAVMMELYKKGLFSMAGIEIMGLPESFSGAENAEDIWDSVCMEIITSSLVTERSADVETLDSNMKEAAVSAVTGSFTDRRRMCRQRTEECHRAVTRCLVKGLYPWSTVETPWFREMLKTLNPKYCPLTRDQLRNTLIPSWYLTERKRVVRELLQVSRAAATCDLWTSAACDHYLTVTLHFILRGQTKQTVLRTKPVYDTHTDSVAEQIDETLQEFGVRDKVVAVTADSDLTVHVTSRTVQLRRLRCFAQILNLAAQRVCSSSAVAPWASRMRAVVVWIRGCSTAQTVLLEKQQLLNLPQQSLILSVQTRWDLLYLMVERFLEQLSAIQATATDPRVQASARGKRLEMPADDELQKADGFVRIMKPLYTSALCVSAEKSPTCSQIVPILKKLEAHCQTQEEDTLFTTTLKENIWADLSTCYKDSDTWKFLQESTALDPRFKTRVDSDEIWCRVKNMAVMASTTQEVSNEEKDGNADDSEQQTPFPKRLRLSALEELFEEEDRALKSRREMAEKAAPPAERVQQEIQLYRNLPAPPTSEDALAWWWERRDLLPLLCELSSSYLCVQASSTPLERMFSTAENTLSLERSHILPDEADMQIFLQKNC